MTPEQQREKERQRDEAERRQTREELFIHTTPKDTCDHDWNGWRDLPNGGEKVCKKCGIGALEHAMRYGD